MSYFMTSKMPSGAGAASYSDDLGREASPFAYREFRANIAGFLS